MESCDEEEYSSYDEFEELLNDDDWSSQRESWGRVWWRKSLSSSSSSYSSQLNGEGEEGRAIKYMKFKQVLRLMLYHWDRDNYFGQFWAPVEVGGRRYLMTSDQPFALSGPDLFHEGMCRHRKYCMDHRYFVGEGAKEEELGPPGRVFRNGRAESSPDLRLYSTIEYPLRDRAARCGLTGYISLPLFDVPPKQCLGVLELFTDDRYFNFPNFALNCLEPALEEVELRSTHLHVLKNSKYEEEPASELREMLKMAINSVPQLYLALVWVPCKECVNVDNNISCMKRETFIAAAAGEEIDSSGHCDREMEDFIKACEFCKLESKKGVIGIVLSSPNKSCFFRNICDLRIYEYPLAHYAQRARLSFHFLICLQSADNKDGPYVVEFILKSNSREDAYSWSALHLLLQIMDEKLQRFKGQIGEELVVEVGIRNMLASCEFGQPNTSLNTYEIIRNVLPKEV